MEVYIQGVVPRQHFSLYHSQAIDNTDIFADFKVYQIRSFISFCQPSLSAKIIGKEGG